MGAASLLMVLLVGCRSDGLAFRQDDRLRILSPDDRATVALPVSMAWTIDGRSQAPPGLHFAVFIDHPPMRPGQDLGRLARGDKACRRTPGCPDASWFEARDIYRTTATTLSVTTLPDTRPTGRSDAKERHEAAIVLLDERGRRIGESAYSVEFFVDRQAKPRG